MGRLGPVLALAAGSRLVAGLKAEDFLETKAAEIRVPVELIWGEEDGVLPLDYGRRLASLLPNARLHPLPRCGHMRQVHCPRGLERGTLAYPGVRGLPPAFATGFI